MKVRLREKLLGGFALVLIFAAAVGVIGIFELQAAAHRTQDVYQKHLLGIQYALTLDASLASSGRDEAKADLEDVGSDAQKALIAQAREEAVRPSTTTRSLSATIRMRSSGQT